jgi:hypothetical protein
LKDVAIGFSKIVTFSGKLTAGYKDTPLDSQLDGYVPRLRQAKMMPVVFYDKRDKVAWLLNGQDALLHLSRSYMLSIHHQRPLPAAVIDSFGDRDPKGEQTAYDILVAPQNRRLCLTPEGESSVDGDAEAQEQEKFEHIVIRFSNILRDISNHSTKLREAAKGSLEIKTKPFTARFEGFGFKDMMKDVWPLRPRFAEMKVSASSWLRFTTANNAINILGSGFGSLISTLGTCLKCTEVPRGYNFLTARVDVLHEMADMRDAADPYNWCLSTGVHWNRPDLAFSNTVECNGHERQHGIQCGIKVVELATTSAIASVKKRFVPIDVFGAHKHAAIIIGLRSNMTLAQREFAATKHACLHCQERDTQVTEELPVAEESLSSTASDVAGSSTLADLEVGRQSTPPTAYSDDIQMNNDVVVGAEIANTQMRVLTASPRRLDVDEASAPYTGKGKQPLRSRPLSEADGPATSQSKQKPAGSPCDQEKDASDQRGHDIPLTPSQTGGSMFLNAAKGLRPKPKAGKKPKRGK